MDWLGLESWVGMMGEAWGWLGLVRCFGLGSGLGLMGSGFGVGWGWGLVGMGLGFGVGWGLGLVRVWGWLGFRVGWGLGLVGVWGWLEFGAWGWEGWGLGLVGKVWLCCGSRGVGLARLFWVGGADGVWV